VEDLEVKRQKSTADQASLLPAEDLLPKSALRRRRPLFLPRFLAREAQNQQLRGAGYDRAFEIIQRWADLDAKSRLRKKETSLDAEFLLEVFGQALGYKPPTGSDEEYNLSRQFAVPGIGTADAALGRFGPAAESSPVVVIELKGASTNLDADKFNGRTPVQQCWDYLNALPNCPWGIVSNFRTIRLYHRDRTPLAFEHFTLEELRKNECFAEFYCLLERGGLLPSAFAEARAVRLLDESGARQREVGDELYNAYSANRLALIHYLHDRRKKLLESAIAIAQKLLDRVIFIAFCEDRGLLPGDTIHKTFSQLPPLSRATNPRWRNFLDLFHAVDQGHPSLNFGNGGYNGGLFRHDPEVDDIDLSDDWTAFFKEIGGYDFRDEINVDVLGHLFEKSVTELERIRTGGLFEISMPAPGPTMPKSAQRKRFGIYYTPPAFTTFIVKNTLGAIVDQRFAELAAKHGLQLDDASGAEPSPELAAYWRECLSALRDIKVCDPACGSGAFLIQAYDLLDDCYHEVTDGLIQHEGPHHSATADSIPDMILADNLFGVDLSPEAVEITQLALWIRSARRGKTLSDLSANIVCGNSLVSDPVADPRALNWPAAFPTIFNRTESGFDCVIGNRPGSGSSSRNASSSPHRPPRSPAQSVPHNAASSLPNWRVSAPSCSSATRQPRRPPSARWPTSAPAASSRSPAGATSTLTCSSPSSPAASSPRTAASACSSLPESPPTTRPRISSPN